jgi:cardiolipin synthase
MPQHSTLYALAHAAFVSVGLLLYVLIAHIGRQQRQPSAAIAWVMGIVAFPYVAVPLFLMVGTRKMTRPLARRAQAEVAPALGQGLQPEWTRSLLHALEIQPAACNRSITFHEDGPQSLASLLALCKASARQLDVGTFILGNDEVGQQVCNALAEAAARGVRTRLLIDAVGSLHASRAMLAQLRRQGVEVSAFTPLLHNPLRGKTNLRNHRKLALADSTRLWAGGRNLAAEYFIDQPGRPAWVDLSFLVEGDLAAAAQLQFDRDWRHAAGRSGNASGTPTEFLPTLDTMTSPAQWVPTGPDRPDDTIYALLLAASYHATQRILAVSPYLVPDEALLDAWCLACRRGVQVCIVMPAHSNHRLADLARRRALRRLVAAGADVRLVDGMVHAKALVFDAEMALCGSANLDGRSLLLNYEVMAAFYGESEIAWLAQWILALHGKGTPLRQMAGTLGEELLEGATRAIGFQL